MPFLAIFNPVLLTIKHQKMVTIDAKNPHVFQPYFFSNLTQQSFQQTGYSQFHRVNNCVAALFGEFFC
jgi:hypothetical protein